MTRLISANYNGTEKKPHNNRHSLKAVRVNLVNCDRDGI
jgi:hypothetical protein